MDFRDIKYKMIFGEMKEQEKIAKAYQLVLNAWDYIKNISSPFFSDVGMRQIVVSL